MLLVPGHNCATLLVPVHKVQNVLTVTYRISAENNMAAWKRSTRIDRSCCEGIITRRFVSLLIKKYQQVKKEETCWQIASRFQFLIRFSES